MHKYMPRLAYVKAEPGANVGAQTAEAQTRELLRIRQLNALRSSRERGKARLQSINDPMQPASD